MSPSLKLINKISLFIIIFSFSSCALLFNGRKTRTHIHTYPANAQIILNKKDTFYCGHAETFSVRRSGYPLVIQAKTDSLEKTVSVRPILSPTYLLPNIGTYFMGYFVDLASKKRFTYPNNIYINLKEKNKVYSTFNKPVADNQLVNLVIHIPFLNVYDFSIAKKILYNQIPSYSNTPINDTLGGQYSFTGFNGLRGSMEYYLNKNYYLSGNFGYFHYLPIGYFSFPYRKYQYMSLSMNRRFNRFHIGAGLAWVKFNYSNDFNSENSDPVGDVDTHGYALRLEAQYQFSNNWYLSTNYQPIIGRDKGGDNNNISFWGLEVNYKIPLATEIRNTISY